MPERPDVTVDVEALERRILGERLEDVRLASPLLLRSVEPPLGAVRGRTVSGVRRLGKRIVIGLEAELFLVLHLLRDDWPRTLEELEERRRSGRS